MTIQDKLKETQDNLIQLEWNSRQFKTTQEKYWEEFKTIQDNLRGTQENSKQLEINLRQFETTWKKLDTVSGHSRRIQNNLRKLKITENKTA